jgi:hypothetical protein
MARNPANSGHKQTPATANADRPRSLRAGYPLRQ